MSENTLICPVCGHEVADHIGLISPETGEPCEPFVHPCVECGCEHNVTIPDCYCKMR